MHQLVGSKIVEEEYKLSTGDGSTYIIKLALRREFAFTIDPDIAFSTFWRSPELGIYCSV